MVKALAGQAMVQAAQTMQLVPLYSGLPRKLGLTGNGEKGYLRAAIEDLAHHGGRNFSQRHADRNAVRSKNFSAFLLSA
jgi:hypothetical protein